MEEISQSSLSKLSPSLDIIIPCCKNFASSFSSSIFFFFFNLFFSFVFFFLGSRFFV